MNCFLRLYLFCFPLLVHAAQQSAGAAASAASLPLTYMQQYEHCSGMVYHRFAGTITSLAPEQAAQLAHGPQHFITAQVLAAAFTESLTQQHADHGSLDAATITTVAQVHAATQQFLTAAGHLHGLATEETVRRVEHKVDALNKKLEATEKEKEAKKAAKKVPAPVATTIVTTVVDPVQRSVTPPAGTAWGEIVRFCRKITS